MQEFSSSVVRAALPRLLELLHRGGRIEWDVFVENWRYLNDLLREIWKINLKILLKEKKVGKLGKVTGKS